MFHELRLTIIWNRMHSWNATLGSQWEISVRHTACIRRRKWRVDEKKPGPNACAEANDGAFDLRADTGENTGAGQRLARSLIDLFDFDVTVSCCLIGSNVVYTKHSLCISDFITSFFSSSFSSEKILAILEMITGNVATRHGSAFSG